MIELRELAGISLWFADWFAVTKRSVSSEDVVVESVVGALGPGCDSEEDEC